MIRRYKVIGEHGVRNSGEGEGMHRFKLIRVEDESGVSGRGHVADGVEFPDGTVAMRWRTATTSVAFYDSMVDLEKIHGHGGKTKVEWIDDELRQWWLRGTTDATQDRYEGSPYWSIGGPDRLGNPQPPAYALKAGITLCEAWLDGYMRAAAWV